MTNCKDTIVIDNGTFWTGIVRASKEPQSKGWFRDYLDEKHGVKPPANVRAGDEDTPSQRLSRELQEAFRATQKASSAYSRALEGRSQEAVDKTAQEYRAAKEKLVAAKTRYEEARMGVFKLR
jgi:GrpB-like predicted nucleotidyltransferase (UPF0157 family)